MSRPKGSKNKPRTDAELIAELKKRGIPIPDNLIPDSGVVAAPQQAKKPAPVVNEIAEVSSGVVREKFALTQNSLQTEKLQETTYRCGNRLCNKLLPSALEKCSYCGIDLKWE